jgi:hypothetical protein
LRRLGATAFNRLLTLALKTRRAVVLQLTKLTLLLLALRAALRFGIERSGRRRRLNRRHSLDSVGHVVQQRVVLHRLWLACHRSWRLLALLGSLTTRLFLHRKLVRRSTLLCRLLCGANLFGTLLLTLALGVLGRFSLLFSIGSSRTLLLSCSTLLLLLLLLCLSLGCSLLLGCDALLFGSTLLSCDTLLLCSGSLLLSALLLLFGGDTLLFRSLLGGDTLLLCSLLGGDSLLLGGSHLLLQRFG